jgi:hypothetical protein
MMVHEPERKHQSSDYCYHSKKSRQRRLGCWRGGARMELSRRNHDQGNGDLRKRSPDLMKKKDNLEGIIMNSRDFLRR